MWILRCNVQLLWSSETLSKTFFCLFFCHCSASLELAKLLSPPSLKKQCWRPAILCCGKTLILQSTVFDHTVALIVAGHTKNCSKWTICQVSCGLLPYVCSFNNTIKGRVCTIFRKKIKCQILQEQSYSIFIGNLYMCVSVWLYLNLNLKIMTTNTFY